MAHPALRTAKGHRPPKPDPTFDDPRRVTSAAQRVNREINTQRFAAGTRPFPSAPGQGPSGGLSSGTY